MVSSEAVAEEALQDTWLGVVGGVERLEGRSPLKTWLFPNLVNRVRSAAARQQRNAPIASPHAVDPARFDARVQWADPLEHRAQRSDGRLEAATWVPILKAALENLPSRQRSVIILRDEEGLTRVEVCTVLSTSAGDQRILLHPRRSGRREILDVELRKG